MIAKAWTIRSVLCVAFGTIIATELPAQSGRQASHRQLPLPAETQFDRQLQMRMLQHLNGLLTRSEKLPAELQQRPSASDGLSSLIKGLNPQQLEALGEAMRLLSTQGDAQLNDETLESLKKAVSELSPDSSQADSSQADFDQAYPSKVDSEPAAATQQRIKQLLEQFSRDRRLPRSQAGIQGDAMLPPVQGLGNSAPQSGGNDRRSADGLVPHYLEQVAKNPNALPPFSLAPAESRLPRLDPGSSPAAKAGASSDAKESGGAGAQLDFEEIVRAANGLRSGTATAPSLRQSDSRPSSDGSRSTFRRPEERAADRSDKIASGRSTPGGIVPEQIVQQLERRGLSKTFGDLLKQARQEVGESSRGDRRTADSAASGGGVSLAGLESTLLSALDGVKDDVLQSLKQSKVGQARTKLGDAKVGATGGSSGASNGDAAPSSGGLDDNGLAKNSGVNGAKTGKNSQSSFRKTAAAWIKSLTESPSVASATGPASSGELGPPLPSGGTWPMGSLLLVVAVVAPAIWWLRQRSQRAAARRLQFARLVGADIRCADDVVRAFHLLAAQFAAEHWWTHRRAAIQLAGDMASTKPEASVAWQTLANLYERARYSPASSPLSDEDMLLARRAIQQCIA